MIIVDTSAVVAAKDEAHPDHVAVAQVLREAPPHFVLSPLVLAEIDYMLLTRFGVGAELEFLEEVAQEAYQLVDFDFGDVGAAAGICRRYKDLKVGVADASLVVLAARYRTVRLLTLDHRHFRIIQPLWGAEAFTLLPADAS